MSLPMQSIASLKLKHAAWPSLDHLWLLLPIALVALRVQLTPIMPHDFWWHLAMGRVIAQTGHIPQVDAWSWTQHGQPYFDQPWLAQVLMYGVYRLGGVPLLALLQSVVLAGTFTLVYRLCQGEGAGPRVAAGATLVGACLGFDNWQIRPQSYALPLFVLAFSVALRWRRTGRAPLWVLPLLMLGWVNLHGTFVLLPVLCGAVWLGAVVQRWRTGTGPAWRACAVFTGWNALALLATILNPHGIMIWRYVGGLLGDRSVQQFVAEWASPLEDLHAPMTIVFLASLGVLVMLLVWRRQRVMFGDVVLLLPFTGLALQSVRNILWFGLVVAPLAARLLAVQRPARKRAEVILFNRLVVALLATMLIVTLPWWKEALVPSPQLGALIVPQTATDAVAQLEALPTRPQRLFHDLGVGSYLTWAAPAQPVFVDTRIELYRYDQWRDYIRLRQGQNIDELTTRYGFDGWLVSTDEQPKLVAALGAHPRWQRIFTTPHAVFFAPRTTPTTAQHQQPHNAKERYEQQYSQCVSDRLAHFHGRRGSMACGP